MQSIFSWLRNTGGSNLFLTTRVISLFMDRRCNAYGVASVCDHCEMDPFMDCSEGCDGRFSLALSTKHLYGSAYSRTNDTYRMVVQGDEAQSSLAAISRW